MYKPNSVLVQYGGSMVAFIGEQSEVDSLQAYLYNRHATSATETESLGDGRAYFWTSKRNLLKYLAGDVASILTGELAGGKLRKVMAAKIATKAQGLAEFWLQSFPVSTSKLIARAIYAEWFTGGNLNDRSQKPMVEADSMESAVLAGIAREDNGRTVSA